MPKHHSNRCQLQIVTNITTDGLLEVSKPTLCQQNEARIAFQQEHEQFLQSMAFSYLNQVLIILTINHEGLSPDVTNLVEEIRHDSLGDAGGKMWIDEPEDFDQPLHNISDFTHDELSELISALCPTT